MGISKGNYPDAVKLQAIKLLQQGKSYIEVQKELDITSSYTIRSWAKKYKAGGIECLLKDNRGRPSQK